MARAVSPRRKLLTTLAAWFVACLIFFPVFWMILTSFKTEASAVASPPELLSADWTLENYVEVWSRSDYPRFFWNSFEGPDPALGGGGLFVTPTENERAARAMTLSASAIVDRKSIRRCSV